MKPALRFLLALLTILSCTTISGAAVQETHAGVVFERVCALEGDSHFSASFNAPKTGGMSLADEMAVLRQATTGKGNFGVGSASHADAMRLGNAWVGSGSRVASDGRTLVSADGLRTFRPPSAKPNSPYATTGVQANFETLERTFFNGVERLKVIRNGHLDITP